MKYRNVTVSGRIGTGTSTLARALEKTLGWKFWSGGEFFRAYCKEHGIPLEQTSLRSAELSRQVDLGMRKRLQAEKGLILEAWLSGFVAQKISGVLKVLLVCKDELRVDRVVNRDGVSVEEAKREIRIREKENLKKWSRIYKQEWQEWAGEEPIDFWDPKLYDLTIDTFSHSREDTLQLVLKKLKNSKTQNKKP